MDAWKDIPFEEILIESKDGEWGQGQEAVGHRRAIVIRGTDFAEIDNPTKQFPERWIKDNLVERKRLQPGDVLLETAGGTAAQSTGRSALLKESFFHQHGALPVLCASFSRHLRLDRKKYDSKFIYYLLQTLYRTGYMAVFNIQHTGVSRFQYTSFKRKTVLKVPLVETQRKIAAILSAYDDLIENNKRRIALLEKMAEEIYREWFVRMRFPGHEKVKFVKGVPEGWEYKELGSLATTQYGYTASASMAEEGPKLLRITDIVPDVIDWDTVPFCKIEEKEEEKYLLQEGDIVVARTGATVGYAKRINKNHPKAVFASYLVRLVPKNKMDAIYLGLSVERDAFKEFIHMFVTGAAQPQANATTMSRFSVLYPNETVLEEFNRSIEPILDQKEKLHVRTVVLSRTRDLLLPRLISGKLSVEDLDIHFPLSMHEQTTTEQLELDFTHA